MKYLIFVLLTFGSIDAHSQIIRDSVRYVSTCRCERAAAKYRDRDNRLYHVFLRRNEVFIIRKEDRYYRKERLKLSR